MLLLDEPFSGLDVGVAAGLRIELVQHLGEFAGVTLLVTHDALDALTLADRVLVLDDGAVAQLGPPAEVAARPRTDHVARLVGLNVLRDDSAIEGAQLTAFRPDAVTVSLSEPEGSLDSAGPARCGHSCRTATRFACRWRGPPTARCCWPT